MSRQRRVPRHQTRQSYDIDDNIEVVLKQYKKKWQKDQNSYRRRIVHVDRFGHQPILTRDLTIIGNYYGQKPSRRHDEPDQNIPILGESKDQYDEREDGLIIGALNITNGKKDERYSDFAVASMTVVDLDTGVVLNRSDDLNDNSIKWVMDKPYIAGYLAFREVEPLVELTYRVMDRLPEHHRPHVLFVGGTGVLHPRMCGLASQLGVMLDMPTIGLTSSILKTRALKHDDFCDWARRFNPQVNDVFKLYGTRQMYENNARPIGYALRVRRRDQKYRGYLFVSTGHRISPMSALKITASFMKPNGRVPWPLERAKKQSQSERKSILQRGLVEDWMESFFVWKKERDRKLQEQEEEIAERKRAEQRKRKERRQKEKNFSGGHVQAPKRRRNRQHFNKGRRWKRRETSQGEVYCPSEQGEREPNFDLENQSEGSSFRVVSEDSGMTPA